MGQVKTAHVDDSPAGGFPDLAGVTSQGAIRSRGVITGGDRPLWLWMHELESGAEIRWNKPVVGHVAYVWKGGLAIDGMDVEPEGVVCIEQGAGALVRASGGGATVLHYHSQAAQPQQSRKPGGRVHVVKRDGIHKVRQTAYYEMVNTVWLDSACATCDLWFHQSRFEKQYPQSNPHFHPEDEIIFVVQGGLVLGRKIHKAGSAIAVDANTVYAFGVDAGGLAFTNFRRSEPHFVMMSRDGPQHEPISEFDHMKKQQPVY